MIALLLIYYISFVGHANRQGRLPCSHPSTTSCPHPSLFLLLLFCGHLLIAPRMRANLFIMRFHNGLHSNKCASFNAASAPGNFYNFEAIFLMMRGRVVLFLLRYPLHFYREKKRIYRLRESEIRNKV